MGKKVKLHKGDVFGNLMVVKEYGKDKWGKYLWECQCQCPDKNIVIVHPYILRKGDVKSCGCLKAERMKGLNFNGGYQKTYPELYSSWQNMKRRCLDKNHPRYDRYGGRGILVCEKWLNIEGFIEDMLPTWDGGLTIDRIDNDKGYYKENCRWTTMKIQANNRSSNKYIEINGKSRQLREWSQVTGIPETTIWHRYESGVRGEDLLNDNSRPVAKYQSGVVGIIWNEKRKKWLVNIKIEGKKKRIGSFDFNDLDKAKRTLETYKTVEDINIG